MSHTGSALSSQSAPSLCLYLQPFWRQTFCTGQLALRECRRAQIAGCPADVGCSPSSVHHARGGDLLRVGGQLRRMQRKLSSGEHRAQCPVAMSPTNLAPSHATSAALRRRRGARLRTLRCRVARRGGVAAPARVAAAGWRPLAARAAHQRPQA